MTEFEQLLAPVPAPLRDEFMRHWRDFCNAAQAAGIAPPPETDKLAALIRVWTGSDFVARICSREPALLTELWRSGDLETGYAAEDWQQRLAERLAEIADEETLIAVLRQFRRREMVRIAWRDLAGLAPLSETLIDLSTLADVAIDEALKKLYTWQTQRFGVPRADDGQAQHLVVFGMGKLGGRELNYSSDIDLIFTFPQKGQTDSRRGLDNEAFFRRLGQRLIHVLSIHTPEGFVFRVDMRLRPFGEVGPLAMSFDVFEDYYQHQGRDWERYAMIKARAVAGDRAAGEQLLARLRPFVYRRYLDYNAIQALRDMKSLIAREVERKGLQSNIKLGPGGIREIEFIAQLFQLIYGGREPALRERSLLRVLSFLAESGRLPVRAVIGLKDAYAFLRRTENRLQAWADQQTYQLPEDATAQARLAFSMDFADWEAFAATLHKHRNAVSAQFERVFAGPDDTDPATDWTALWAGTMDTDNAVRLLADRGFAEPERAWQALQTLRQSLAYRSLSRRGRERMDRLLPLALQEIVAAAQPARTLERIADLLTAIARRSVYLALLVENPQALAQLVRLCAASVWIAQYLARYPLLLDELLDPATLYKPLDRARLASDLEQELARAPADDTEQRLDNLRHFKHANVLRVAAADVSGTLPLMIVSDHLTEIAEVLLRKVLELAWADQTVRYGKPCCVIDGERRAAQFAIIAYGKLGGIELNYGSDLDLVFLYDGDGTEQHTDGPRQIDNATFFARLTRRIIYWLTTPTSAGKLYEVDIRLRPSGRAGLLVSSMDAFAKYQHHQAWTWEHQALARARVVAGSATLAERFAALRREVLSRTRDPAVLREEVRAMRERMREQLGSTEPGCFQLKQDPGGIADIEFMVQYNVLANARRYPELLTYTDNIRQLDGLEQAGVLSTEDATLLRDAYRGLRRRSHLLTLQDQSSLVPADDAELRPYRQAVSRLWQRIMEQD